MATKSKRSFYEVLELQEDATEEVIKRSYKKLALKWHPDRNKAPEATARFQEINEAYSVLIDPAKRDVYDRTGDADVEEADFNEFFAQVFGSMFGAGFTFADLTDDDVFELNDEDDAPPMFFQFMNGMMGGSSSMPPRVKATQARKPKKQSKKAKSSKSSTTAKASAAPVAAADDDSDDWIELPDSLLHEFMMDNIDKDIRGGEYRCGLDGYISKSVKMMRTHFERKHLDEAEEWALEQDNLSDMDEPDDMHAAMDLLMAMGMGGMPGMGGASGGHKAKSSKASAGTGRKKK